MASANNIIEQLESEKDESGFDATAFISSETAKEVESLEETPTPLVAKEVEAEVVEGAPTNTPTNTESVKEDNSDGFDWDEIEVEAKIEEPVLEVEEEKSDEDWDSVEKPKESFDWNEVGQELGVNAKTKEEFVSQVKDMMANPVKDNDTITNLQEFLKNDDAALVKADLEAANYDEEYITDTVSRLQDSGLLKREATQIRQQLQKYIRSERDKLKNAKTSSEQEERAGQEQARKDLQGHIKGKKDFFGGKVSNADKKELYGYITKGDFSKEIFETHANVAEAAFLWKNKSKIFKMMKTRGVEQGKSSILDNITAPSKTTRSSNSFETKSEGFDAKAFLG
tara:strand:+ start:5663 stop:6682 length:1020 start_codon:yes stop_codon:yes gene_type:complete